MERPPSRRRVLIVVVHFGEPGLTLRCLTSVGQVRSHDVALDVVVVDNGPGSLDRDAMAEVLPSAVVVEPGSNVGFAAGVNLGVAHGAGAYDFVGLLNNDAVAEPGWLEPLIEALEADAGLGAACSKIVLEEPPAVINSAGLRLVEHGFGADRGYLEPDEGQYDSPEEVFGWCGGAVLLRAAYLADVGPLDEHFFAYYEDFDLSWRGRLLGWRYRYVPTSVVHHRHAAGLGVGSEEFRFLVGRNRLLALAKLAPMPMVARAALVEVKLAFVGGPGSLRRHGRILASALRWLPAMIVARRRLRRRCVVSDEAVLAWTTPR
jgi:GT2 family glycosyltransferase